MDRTMTPPPATTPAKTVVAPDIPRTLRGGWDARCHLCGRGVYVLWVDRVPPDNGCLEGATRVTDCQEAMEWAKVHAGLLAYLRRIPAPHEGKERD